LDIRGFVAGNALDGVHVVSGGAQLVDPKGSPLRETLIPADTMHTIAQAVERVGGYLVVKQSRAMYGTALAFQVGARHATTPKLPLAEIRDWSAVSFYVSDIDDETWAMLESRTDIALLKQRIRSASGVVKDAYCADGSAPGVNKLTGVRWWCEHHQLDPQAIIGIGDGENDFDLFKGVGFKLAVENAVPELKAAADEVIPSLNKDGVAWAIDRYFG